MSDETLTVEGLLARPASPTIVIYHREGAAVAQLHPDRELVVGRQAPADLVVDDESLSRQHCRLLQIDQQVQIEDLESKNGTFVNGQRVTCATIAADDDVRIGSVVLALQDARPLEGHDRFLPFVEKQLVRARLLRRRLALVVLRSNEGHVRAFYPKLRELLGADDRIALYADGVLEVLVQALPNDELQNLGQALQQRAKEAGVVLGCGMAVFPDSAGSVDELIQRAHDAAVAAAPGRLVVASRPPTRSEKGAAADSSPVVVGVLEAVYEVALQRLAPSSIPVLITGETGTGKEVLAKAIHHASPRRSQPLRSVNCGALPAELVESLLFGHERGAFTGADARRRGLFEEAHNSTLLLDEVGELSGSAQAALLRVLENNRFCRVGSADEIAVDVRVIAATNRDLAALCEDGLFRRDLLYRLDAMAIELPPLRQWPEAIERLVARFLAQATAQGGVTATSVGQDALELLRGYHWPGNVRELRNVITRAAVIARGETVGVDDLPRAVRANEETTPNRDGAQLQFKQRIQRYEAELILEALQAASWNQTEAARQLQMPLRSMVRKISAYGLRKE